MLAGLGHAARAPAQHRVGFRRAVAADDPDRLLGARLAMDFPKEVDHVGVHLDRLFLTPVAQLVVDLVERGLVVAAVHLVGDGEVLAGVSVMKGDRAGIAFGGRILQALAPEDDQERGDAAAIAHPKGRGAECSCSKGERAKRDVAQGKRAQRQCPPGDRP